MISPIPFLLGRFAFFGLAFVLSARNVVGRCASPPSIAGAGSVAFLHTSRTTQYCRRSTLPTKYKEGKVGTALSFPETLMLPSSTTTSLNAMSQTFGIPNWYLEFFFFGHASRWLRVRVWPRWSAKLQGRPYHPLTNEVADDAREESRSTASDLALFICFLITISANIAFESKKGTLEMLDLIGYPCAAWFILSQIQRHGTRAYELLSSPDSRRNTQEELAVYGGIVILTMVLNWPPF